MESSLRLKYIIQPMLITLVILILLEIFSSTVMPIMGVVNYRLSFNILIIIYMGFRIQAPVLALQIAAVQYVHSMFTIEGWELGTIAGIIICVAISYLREVLHLSSALLTILVMVVFQLAWFLLVAIMMLIQSVEFAHILDKFWHFLPEGAVLALIAPLCFRILDLVWQGRGGESAPAI